MVFIMETPFVFCKVRTDVLNVFYNNEKSLRIAACAEMFPICYFILPKKPFQSKFIKIKPCIM